MNLNLSGFKANGKEWQNLIPSTGVRNFVNGTKKNEEAQPLTNKKIIIHAEYLIHPENNSVD